MNKKNKCFLFLALILGNLFFVSPTMAQSASLLEYFKYNKTSCKSSLRTTTEALLSEKFHPHCLTLARKRLYRPKSNLKDELSKYPLEIQEIYLELLNRRLDGGHYYKHSLRSLYKMAYIIKKYVLLEYPLDQWKEEKAHVLNTLESLRISTPKPMKIDFLPLSKFIKENNPLRNSHRLDLMIERVYLALANVHLEGIRPAFNKLKEIIEEYIPKQEPVLPYLMEQLTLFEEQLALLEASIQTIYKAAYFPPKGSNKKILKQSVRSLSFFRKFSKLLQDTNLAITVHCGQKGLPPAACASLPLRYENLAHLALVINLFTHDFPKEGCQF